MDRSTPLTSPGVVVPRLGGPEVLRVQPWQIAGPAPDEVRVRVEAAGISFADLLVMQGVHPERRKPPFVPGWDVVEEVESANTDHMEGRRFPPGAKSASIRRRAVLAAWSVAGTAVRGGPFRSDPTGDHVTSKEFLP